MDWLRGTDFWRSRKFRDQRDRNEFTEGTTVGGLISVVGTLILVCLFFLEFQSFLITSKSTQVRLDYKDDPQLVLYFNISMNRLPCELLSLDVVDVVGSRRYNVSSNIRRWKLAEDGERRMNEIIHDPSSEINHDDHTDRSLELTSTLKVKELTFTNFEQELKNGGYKLVLVAFYAPWCIWCKRLRPVWDKVAEEAYKIYGNSVLIARLDCTNAQTRNDYVCMTQNVNAFPTISFFKDGSTTSHQQYHGDRTVERFMATIRQHVHDKEALMPSEADRGLNAKSHEDVKGPIGCLIKGSIVMNKVPGTLFLTAASKTHSFSAELIDTSHRVDYFWFTQKELAVETRSRKQAWSPMREAQLERIIYRERPYATTLFNTKDYVSGGVNQTIEHYLKVINHVYREQNTYKYSMNTHQYRNDEIMAAAKFSYDISPLVVEVKDESKPFYSFITSVCAIIGGVYTVLGLVDSIAYLSLSKLQRKGKKGM